MRCLLLTGKGGIRLAAATDQATDARGHGQRQNQGSHDLPPQFARQIDGFLAHPRAGYLLSGDRQIEIDP
jgi:hypothetical protein